MTLTLVKSPDEAAETERLTLAALRHEIDLLDSEMVALFQKRLALADRVGLAKDAPTGGYVKLRPDREQAVLAHVLQQAKPDTRDAVEALWREVVGHGLARQGQLSVRVWAPVEPARAFDAARLRFGRAAALKTERDPQAALAFAAEGKGIAVLAINAGDPWWMGLRREWAALSVFEGFGKDIPTSLAVGERAECLRIADRDIVHAGKAVADQRCSGRVLHDVDGIAGADARRGGGQTSVQAAGDVEFGLAEVGVARG